MVDVYVHVSILIYLVFIIDIDQLFRWLYLFSSQVMAIHRNHVAFDFLGVFTLNVIDSVWVLRKLLLN